MMRFYWSVWFVWDSTLQFPQRLREWASTMFNFCILTLFFLIFFLTKMWMRKSGLNYISEWAFFLGKCTRWQCGPLDSSFVDRASRSRMTWVYQVCQVVWPLWWHHVPTFEDVPCPQTSRNGHRPMLREEISPQTAASKLNCAIAIFTSSISDNDLFLVNIWVYCDHLPWKNVIASVTHFSDLAHIYVYVFPPHPQDNSHARKQTL